MEIERKIYVGNSEFKGSYWDYIGISILAYLITIFTLGILYPFSFVLRKRYFINNSYIEGRRLEFVGTAWGILGNWIKWMLLTIITLGIYGLIVEVKMKQWEVENTIFAN